MLCVLHYALFIGGEAAPAQGIPVDMPTIETVAGTTEGYSGDGGPATEAQLDEPWDVAVDRRGNIYIADTKNHCIRKVDVRTGNISTIAGTGTAGYSGDGGSATAAELNSPFSVIVDGSGNVYIADSENNRIRRIDRAGIISTIAGTGAESYGGDGGPAATAQLRGPRGVAVDGSGNVYIADTGNERIRRIDRAGIISTIAGTGVEAYGGDGGPAAAAQLDAPRGLTFDGAGNLYFADQWNERIRKIDASGIISTVAGNGSGTYGGDGGPAASASLQSPASVAVDGAGNIFIGDRNNYRVRKVDAATGVITTVAGNADYGLSGDGGPPEAAQLDEPAGLALDSIGNLYIADSHNDRIRKVTFYRPPPPPPGPDPAVFSQSFSLSFMAAQGGEPEEQTITLYAEGGAADFRAIPSARWIEAAPRSGKLAAGGEATLTVTVNPAGLREGRHDGRLYIRSDGRVTATIRIVLEVPPPTGPAVTENGGVFNAARMSAYGERGLFGPQLLPLSPGAAVIVQGVNFLTGERIADAGFPLPTMLGGVRVLIDGAAVPLMAVGPQRIEAQLPWALGGEAVAAGGLALASVVVESGGESSWPRHFWAGPYAPGVFTVSGEGQSEGQGQALATFAGTTDLAAPLGFSAGSRPARAGDVLEIYATGLGAVEPPISDGMNSCAPDGVCLEDGSNAVLRHTVARPQVWVGAYAVSPENVRFSGLAPDMAGVNLVVVEVPRNLVPSEAAELRLAVAGRISQSGATIAVE